MRVTESVMPPAVYGTTHLIGRAGYCAGVSCAVHVANAIRMMRASVLRVMMPSYHVQRALAAGSGKRLLDEIERGLVQEDVGRRAVGSHMLRGRRLRNR